MRVYYQGTLDFFCAAYAVLNALTLTHGLALAKAKDVFVSTLAEVSAQPRLWQATLVNDTDFHWLVRFMLARLQGRFPIHISCPFAPDADAYGWQDLSQAPLRLNAADRGIGPAAPGLAAVWQKLDALLAEGRDAPVTGRAVILRFHRYETLSGTPIVAHWTCGERMLDNVLMLRDASREENALHSLARETIVTREKDVAIGKAVLLEPASVWFLRAS